VKAYHQRRLQFLLRTFCYRVVECESVERSKFIENAKKHDARYRKHRNVYKRVGVRGSRIKRKRDSILLSRGNTTNIVKRLPIVKRPDHDAGNGI